MEIKLALLPLIEITRRQPWMGPQVGCRTDLGNAVLAHLVLGEPLLHAETDEILVVIAKPAKHLDQGQNLLVLLL